jgi:photosystem II stability/assembly factor-like uncharacterized protein
MTRFLRSPATGLAALYTGILAVLFLSNSSPEFMQPPPGFDIKEAEPYRESAKMLEYHYIQRAYGSSDVNVDMRLWDAWKSFAHSPQSALLKPFPAAATWRLEGPTNIGGRMRAVAFHPTETNTIYAGGAAGGVWRSTDLGVSWTPLSDFEPRINIGALAIDQSNPEVIYAGTGEPIPGGYGRKNGSPFYDGVGVLRSSDAGEHWTLLPWPANSSAVYRVALHPNSSDTLLVATKDKLWKSTDAGQSWSNSLSGVITDVLYKPGDPATVFAAVGNDYGGSSNGVYVSYTGGSRFSWEKLDVNFAPGDSIGRIVLSISAAAPDRIYAAVALNRNRMPDPDVDFKGMFVSKDAGMTWERKLSAINNGFARGQAYYDLTMLASPSDPDLVFMGGIDMYRSTNGGNGFEKRSRWELRTADPNNPAYVHADQHHIAFKPDDPNVFIVGNDGGVFLSTNKGESWEMRNTGLATTQFYGISYSPSNSDLLYGGTQDNSNMRQATPGQTKWIYVGGGDGGRIAVDPDNSNLMYLCINSTPYRTFDGVNLEPLVNGLQNHRFNWIRPMVLDPSGDRLFTASNNVHRLSPAKDATSWLTITPSQLTSSIITDLEIPEPKPRFMFAATGDGQVYLCENLIALDPEWYSLSEGLPNRWISDLTLGWGSVETAYVALSGYGTGHAYKTSDGGESWFDISGDLPDIPANAIVPSRTDSNAVFLATDIGVWYTINGGTNWKQFGNGLPNVVSYDMKLTPENRLIVGTFGRGIWSTDAVTSISTPVVQPSTIALRANYPNPFGAGIAGVTTLTYDLEQAADVRLQVIDAAGRVVATLAQGRVQAGTHTAQFHAGNLSAGTYLAVLRSGTQSAIRKMVLVR